MFKSPSRAQVIGLSALAGIGLSDAGVSLPSISEDVLNTIRGIGTLDVEVVREELEHGDSLTDLRFTFERPGDYQIHVGSYRINDMSFFIQRVPVKDLANVSISIEEGEAPQSVTVDVRKAYGRVEASVQEITKEGERTIFKDKDI